MADVSKTTRGSKIHYKQKEMLVEYVTSKPDLVSGKFKPSFTYKDAEQEWTTVSNILNSMPGANKDWKGWRKTWQDIRCRTKGKLGQNIKNSAGTGGGPLREIQLTSVESNILNIIKPVAIHGHEEVDESVVDFSFLSQDPEGPMYDAPSIEHNTIADSLPSTSGTNPNNKISPKVRRISKNKENLPNSAEATAAYTEYLKEKNEIKEQHHMKKHQYYDKKIEILTRMAVAAEESARTKSTT